MDTAEVFMDTQLSVEEALTLAVRVREELGARFDELADHLEYSRNTEVAALLREVATRQRERSSVLRQEVRGKPARVVGTLRHFELPDYSAIRAHMTLHQALHIAVEAETAVHEWFTALMQQTEDTDVQRLLGELRGEADRWRDRLQSLGSEELDPALFADEPVAH
jgi:hypothetical protein